MNVYYSPDYNSTSTEFDTTRKASWVADSLLVDPIPGVTLVPPTPLTFDQLTTVHTREYVQAVLSGWPQPLAESSGFDWDSRVWDAVTASNGGLVAATLDALANQGHAGSLSSGLHHAYADHGSGFCTFNGLALAAQQVSRAGKRVLILDLDAHCGGGTYSLVKHMPNVVHTDISVSRFDAYTPSSPHTLEIIDDPVDYLPAVARRLAALDSFDVVIYNAGVDIVDMPGLAYQHVLAREQMVYQWAHNKQVPVAFTLAGGYTDGALGSQAALVSLHRAVMESFFQGRPLPG